jgi:hypothetical protein
MLTIFSAAVLLSFHGDLGASSNTIPRREISGFPAQIHPGLAANYGKLPLSFEANQGQAGAGVKFLSRGRGVTLFLTGNEAVLELQESGARSQETHFAAHPGWEVCNGPGTTSR